MMSRRSVVIVLATVVAVMLLTVTVDPALAQNANEPVNVDSGPNPFRGIAKTLQGWAFWGVLGGAAIGAMAAAFSKNIRDGFEIFILMVVLGSIVLMTSGTLKSLVQPLLDSVAQSV